MYKRLIFLAFGGDGRWIEEQGVENFRAAWLMAVVGGLGILPGRVVAWWPSRPDWLHQRGRGRARAPRQRCGGRSS